MQSASEMKANLNIHGLWMAMQHFGWSSEAWRSCSSRSARAARVGVRVVFSVSAIAQLLVAICFPFSCCLLWDGANWRQNEQISGGRNEYLNTSRFISLTNKLTACQSLAKCSKKGAEECETQTPQHLMRVYLVVSLVTHLQNDPSIPLFACICGNRNLAKVSEPPTKFTVLFDYYLKQWSILSLQGISRVMLAKDVYARILLAFVPHPLFIGLEHRKK